MKSWRVNILIISQNSKILANLFHGSNSLLFLGREMDGCASVPGAIRDEGFKLLHSFWYFGVLQVVLGTFSNFVAEYD